MEPEGAIGMEARSIAHTHVWSAVMAEKIWPVADS